MAAVNGDKPVKLSRKAATDTDELAGYRESTLVYLFRFIPRCIYRTLRWLNKEERAILNGVMAPVDTEGFTESLQVVEGVIPKELCGVFLRTGPNRQHKPVGGYHFFDGEAMVHVVRCGDGQALSYSNQWLRTKRYLIEKAAGCNLFMRIGDMKGLLGLALLMLSNIFHFLLIPTKNDRLVNSALGNTMLQWHNGKLLALNEVGYPFLLKLCAGLVKSISTFTFGGSLEHSFTAHPKVDPKSGEMLSFSYEFLKQGVKGANAPVGYFSVSQTGQKGKTHPVDVQGPQMMHDFAITENFAIFMDHALVFSLDHMVKARSLAIKTDLSRPSRIGLLKRVGPELGLQWFEVEPFVCLHTGAAWEEGSNVHFIACRYESLDLGVTIDNNNNPPATPTRYTMDVATGEVTRTALVTGYDLEFPVIPPHLVARPAKFTYMAGNVEGERCDGIRMNHIVKVCNTAEEGEGLVGIIKLPEALVGGEWVYVSRAQPSRALDNVEDDGWLVGFASDEVTLKSYFLVFDAKTMAAKPVAKVAMPQRVPLGLHGTWVYNEQLKMQDKVLE